MEVTWGQGHTDTGSCEDMDTETQGHLGTGDTGRGHEVTWEHRENVRSLRDRDTQTGHRVTWGHTITWGQGTHGQVAWGHRGDTEETQGHLGTETHG